MSGALRRPVLTVDKPKKGKEPSEARFFANIRFHEKCGG